MRGGKSKAFFFRGAELRVEEVVLVKLEIEVFTGLEVDSEEYYDLPQSWA